MQTYFYMELDHTKIPTKQRIIIFAALLNFLHNLQVFSRIKKNAFATRPLGEPKSTRAPPTTAVADSRGTRVSDPCGHERPTAKDRRNPRRRRGLGRRDLDGGREEVEANPFTTSDQRINGGRKWVNGERRSGARPAAL